MQPVVEHAGEKLYRFSVSTHSHTELVDITGLVADAVRKSGVKEGVCIVYIPHTTAGVTINENADPDVKTDILKELGKIVPWEEGYLHAEGNSAAHLKASLMGFSQTVIIHDGALLLGIWQGIYLAEFDGSRNRTVFVKVVSC
jgi:secondary thiamine-phosphate synthase enzyme